MRSSWDTGYPKYDDVSQRKLRKLSIFNLQYFKKDTFFWAEIFRGYLMVTRPICRQNFRLKFCNLIFYLISWFEVENPVKQS